MVPPSTLAPTPQVPVQVSPVKPIPDPVPPAPQPTFVTASMPAGPSTGKPNQLLTFSTSASTNIAGSIEYRFDWGDESYSSWSSSPNASHSWSSPVTYRIRTQARVIPAFTSEWSTGLGVVITSPSPQVINYTMQPNPGVFLGIPSWVRYGKFLNAGEEFKGTVSLSGYTPSIDWNNTWYFEVYDPQDNLVDKKSYTFSSGAVKSFSYTASHAGTWKIKVSHYSFYSRDLRIEILPAGWSKIDNWP